MPLHPLLKQRLKRDRPMAEVTLRLPVDAVESMQNIAPKKGFDSYRYLLKSYISNGLRADEAEFVFNKYARLIESLKRRGVSDDMIAEAERDLV